MTTNYKHLEGHLFQDPLSIPDAFFTDPAMPVKRCPTCRKVWLQRKRGGGPPTCKACSRGSVPRSGSGMVSRAHTPSPAAHPSPAPARPHGSTTPREPPAPASEMRPAAHASFTLFSVEAPVVPPEAAARPRPAGQTPESPTLHDVCLLDVRVMAHIPKALRGTVARSWGAAWSAAAWKNTGDAWVSAFMFASAALHRRIGAAAAALRTRRRRKAIDFILFYKQIMKVRRKT